MKHRGLKKCVAAFVVASFMAQCCATMALPGQAGESVVVRYQGQAVASVAELPPDARVTVSYAFGVSLDELTQGSSRVIALPEPLIAVGEGSFTLMAQDAAGNGIAAGHASIGADKSSVAVFLLASNLPEPPQQPIMTASETGFMPQQYPTVGGLTVSFDVECVVNPLSIRTTQAPGEPQPPASPTAAEAPPAIRPMGILTTSALEGAVTIDDVILYKKVGGVSNVVAPNDTLMGADDLILRYQFTISDSQSASFDPDTQYTVPLPNGLKWKGSLSTSINATISPGVEKQFATLSVSGGVAYLVFEGDYWNAYDDVNDAYIELSCGLDLDAINGVTPFTINFYGGGSVTVKVGDIAPKPEKLEKTGSYDSGANRFNWTVTYTPGTEELDRPIEIVDTFDSAKQIYVGNATFAGSPVTPSVSTDSITNITTVRYVMTPDPPAGTPVEFKYQTALADETLIPGTTAGDSATSVTNRADLYDKNNQAVPGITASKSVDVPADAKKWIVKGGAISSDRRSILWTVTIQTFDRRLDNLTMYDSFPEGLELVQSSIRINGSALPSSSATLAMNPAEAPAASFALRFTKPYSAVYTVTYTTTVDSKYFEGAAPSINFDNNAWLDYTWHAYDGNGPDIPFTPPSIGTGVGVNTHILLKGGNYESASHEITWTLTVNYNGVNVVSGQITDDLSARGLEYSGGFSTSQPSLITLNSATDTDNLIIDVGALGTGQATVTFKTKVKNPLDYGYNKPGGTPYKNIAAFDGQVNFTVDGVKAVTDTAEANVSVTSEVIKKEARGYNYNTNEVTWRVTVNQNNMPMTNAIVEDTVSAGQTFVDGSVTRVGANQAPDSSVYTASKLTMTWNTLNAQTVVEYKTKVDVDHIADFKSLGTVTVTNSATLKRDGYNDTALAPVSQSITNKLLSKTGTHKNDEGLIAYAVNINPSKLDLDGCTVSDVIPVGLQLDIKSVELYEASVSASLTFTEGNKVTDPGFTAKYDISTRTLTVSFPAGNKSYILKYDCYVDYSKAQTFQNNISFNGNIFSGGISGDGSSVNVGGGGGAGSGGNAKKASLVITKEDSADSSKKLAGVKFELYSLNGGVEELVMESVTNASGQATFNPLELNQDYILKEAQGLAGYGSPMVLIAGVSEPLNNTIINYDQKGAKALTITNSVVNTNVRFTKVNDANLTVDGVEFKIKDQNSSYTQTATSANGGIVAFSNVPYGKYDLTETQTVARHTLNSEVFKLEVKQDGSFEITNASGIPVQEIENVVEKGSIELTILIDGTTTPLAGVEFMLENRLGAIVKQTTGPDGKIFFDNLAIGEDYWVREVSPSGYLPTADVLFSITDANADYMVDWPKTPLASAQNSSSGRSSGWSGGVIIAIKDPLAQGPVVVAVEDKKISPPQTSWK